MQNRLSIQALVDSYNNSGTHPPAPLLVHKRMHRDGSGEFACALGLANGCPNAVSCASLYFDSQRRPYCLNDPETPSCGGLIAVEGKHERLVVAGAVGAYLHLGKAISFALAG